MSEVEITTDGSCLGNPGPGGWACILRCGQHERVLQGGVADTTNNRMELFAAIEGLRALKRASRVTVLTDSEYVRRGITEFLPRWKANGWRASTGKPVVNRDLWEELEELAGYHEVTWIHVRGHSGQPNHERCDSLAVMAARGKARCCSGVSCWSRKKITPCSPKAWRISASAGSGGASARSTPPISAPTSADKGSTRMC